MLQIKALTIAAVVLLTTTAHAGIITADVAVQFPGGQYAPLQNGELLNTNWNRYFWNEIPTFAENGGFEFWQVERSGFPSPVDGITTFEVLTDGPVLLAVTTRWGGGGNSSGGWVPELTTQAEFESQGWSVFATGLADSRNGVFPNNVIDYVIYRRDSTAGEVFTYRTEKYIAPIVIRGSNVVPEPASCLAWILTGLGAVFFRGIRRSKG